MESQSLPILDGTNSLNSKSMHSRTTCITEGEFPIGIQGKKMGLLSRYLTKKHQISILGYKY